MCPDVYNSAIPFINMRDRLEKTFGYNGYPPGENQSEDWNEIAGPAGGYRVKVANNHQSKQCGHPTGSVPAKLPYWSGTAYLSSTDLATVEIRIYAFDTSTQQGLDKFRV